MGMPRECDMPRSPERIYGWLNTQMSIARHYGEIKFNGHRYVVARDEDGQPLVRADVLRREAKAKRAALKSVNSAGDLI